MPFIFRLFQSIHIFIVSLSDGGLPLLNMWHKPKRTLKNSIPVATGNFYTFKSLPMDVNIVLHAVVMGLPAKYAPPVIESKPSTDKKSITLLHFLVHTPYLYAMQNLWIALGLTLFAGLATGIGSAPFWHRVLIIVFICSYRFSAGVMLYVSFVEIFLKGPRRSSLTMEILWALGQCPLLFWRNRINWHHRRIDSACGQPA